MSVHQNNVKYNERDKTIYKKIFRTVVVTSPTKAGNDVGEVEFFSYLVKLFGTNQQDYYFTIKHKLTGKMRRLILVVHTSLDGFVAGVKGELDGFDASEENLEFVCGLTEEADTALFGRISYQLLDSHWPTAKDLPGASKGTVAYSNWYNSAHKIVISKTLPKDHLNNSTIISENIPNEIIKIKEGVGKDILIFGSPATSQLLMQHGLIDEYRVFVNPAIFGKGIPLFAPLLNNIKLRLLASKQFSNGEIALHYVAV
jgi:dihydrofolate reductase